MAVPAVGMADQFLTGAGQALSGLRNDIGALPGIWWPANIPSLSAGMVIGVVAMLLWNLGSRRIRSRNAPVGFAPPAAAPAVPAPPVLPAPPAWPAAAAPEEPAAEPVVERHVLVRWLLHDSPYIAMLLLALTAVILRLPLMYWVVLVPVFAAISAAEGWRHFAGRSERRTLLCRLALSWLALLVAILLLFGSGVQGVLNANATSLAMMILLALGTFVSGVQARVWQICAVGGLLFLAVPGLGWLDQSPLLLAASAFAVIVLGGVGWWLSQWQRDTATGTLS